MKFSKSAARIVPDTVNTSEIAQTITDLYNHLEHKTQPEFGKILQPLLTKAFNQRDSHGNNSLILLLNAYDKKQNTIRQSSNHHTPIEEQIVDLDITTYHDEYLDALYCLLGATSKSSDTLPQKELLNTVNRTGETPLLIALRNNRNDPQNPRHIKALEAILSCQNLDIAHSIYCLADKNPYDRKTLQTLLEIYETNEQDIVDDFKKRTHLIQQKSAKAQALSHDVEVTDLRTNKESVSLLEQASNLSKQTAYESQRLSQDVQQYQKKEREYESLSTLTYIMRESEEASNTLLQSRHFMNNISNEGKHKIMHYLIAECQTKLDDNQNADTTLQQI